MEFRKYQLKNGLTVIGEIKPSARSMALGFFVRTGSRDETPDIAGVSHFLEHMMFKGTNNRSAMEVNLEFDRMGAKYNAFTSEENTVFYAAVLPEYQERVLELWSDLMRPALRDDDFNTEKGVICEEIAMYKDLPHFDVMDRCRRLHFDHHPCGNSVLGTVQSIQRMTSQGMREYFKRRYTPDNMVLACSGQITWDKIVDLAEKYCQAWQPGNPVRDLTDFRGTGSQEVVVKENVVREHICMIYAGPSAQDDRHYAASVLANIIGDDTGSRLYWALVDTAQADSADMDYDAADGTGAFYTYISSDPSNASKVIELAKDTIASVYRDGVTPEELEAGKNKIASRMTLSGELPMGRLVPLGFNWLYRGDYYSLEEELQKIMAVTPGDIHTLLEAYPLDNPTILGLGPCKTL